MPRSLVSSSLCKLLNACGLLALGAACGGANTPTTTSAGSGPSGIKTVVLGKAGTSGGTPAPAVAGQNVPAIKVDTVGYPSDWQKLAIANIQPKNLVVKNKAGKVVLRIGDDKILGFGIDKSSQDEVWQVDFSELRTPGRYTLESDGAKSDPFTIGKQVYAKAVRAGLKSFFFQRTRMALAKPYAIWEGDAYTRKTASHVHKDVGWDLNDYPKKKRKWKLEGGWHDAGNYDMYVPSTAPSAQTLLLAYEWAPEAFGDRVLNIPESGNGIPDILDETKWGLIWVLSMQEPNGAFRHREAVMKWTPEKPADEDLTVRWVASVSTAGTAKAVSALAFASRIYEKFDPSFAKRCRVAAEKGWAFLQKNPKRIRVEHKGSEQPKWDDEPGNSEVGAQFIAATEVWRTWRAPEALNKVKRLMSAKETQAAEMIKGAWANLSRWGLATLATDEKTPDGLRQEAKKRILAGAELLRTQAHERDGYRCASTPEDYYWAHNSNLMEKTHVLAVAAKLAPSGPAYRQAARDQWHWVLGRNPNGFSMVTRVGKGPDRLYHMEWGAKEPPPPGFLIGGPNSVNMGFLAPGAPAKALLWDNPMALRSGLAPHSLWHWRQSDLWDGGFVPEGKWTAGWWAVTEPDILYSANFVLAGVSIQ